MWIPQVEFPISKLPRLQNTVQKGSTKKLFSIVLLHIRLPGQPVGFLLNIWDKESGNILGITWIKRMFLQMLHRPLTGYVGTACFIGNDDRSFSTFWHLGKTANGSESQSTSCLLCWIPPEPPRQQPCQCYFCCQITNFQGYIYTSV